jgi:hypothetical protein
MHAVFKLLNKNWATRPQQLQYDSQISKLFLFSSFVDAGKNKIGREILIHIENERSTLQLCQSPPESLDARVHYTVCSLPFKLYDLIKDIANGMESELQLQLTGWRPSLM